MQTNEPTTDDLISAAQRYGGLAARLAAEVVALQRQLRVATATIDSHCARIGPEHLVDHDRQLAAWLADVAADYPHLEEPTEPLGWPVGDRIRLEKLIEQRRGADRNERRTLAEELQIHAEICELCESNGCEPDLADALIGDVPLPPVALRAAA